MCHSGVDTSVPHSLWLGKSGLMAGSMLVISLLSAAALAQTEPYRYYGGEIETEIKNAAIEACEYRVLVQEQRCNQRANKTACITEVHKECRQEYSDKASKKRNKEEN